MALFAGFALLCFALPSGSDPPEGILFDISFPLSDVSASLFPADSFPLPLDFTDFVIFNPGEAPLR